MAFRRKVAAVLEIYVGPDCLGCAMAYVIAAEMRALNLPNVRIRVIDLGDPVNLRPASVFAIPTYLLNGNVLSLGNPEADWLRDRLTNV